MVAIAVGFWLLSLLLPAMRPSGPHSVTGLDVLYHSTLYVVQGVWSYELGGFTTAMAAVAAFLNWAFLVSACIMLWTDRHIHGAWVLLIAATILGLSYVHIDAMSDVTSYQAGAVFWFMGQSTLLFAQFSRLKHQRREARKQADEQLLAKRRREFELAVAQYRIEKNRRGRRR